MTGQKGGDRGQQPGLCGERKPVAFARKKLEAVGHVEAGEQGVERGGIARGNDRVGRAVKDEGRRKGGGGLRGERLDKAARNVDQAARHGRGTLRGEGKRQERAERDADERDALWVDRRAGGNVVECVGEGFQPEPGIGGVGQGGGVGACGTGTVEIVNGEEGDAEPGDEGSNAVEPEAGVAAGPVKQEDGRGGRGPGGLGDGETDGAASAEKGFGAGLHGYWMRG